MKLQNLRHAGVALVVGLVLASCNNAPKGYTITGTAEGTADGDTVYLCDMQGYFSMIPVDTTVIADGKFYFEGQQDGAAMRFVLPMHDGSPTTYAQIILENADFRLALKQGSDAEHEIVGGPSTKLYDEFEAGLKDITEQMTEPWQQSMDSTQSEVVRKAAEAKLDSLQQATVAYQKQFITAHVPSALSDMLLAYVIQDLEDKEADELLKLMGEKQPDYPIYKAIMQEREASEATAIGHKYTDIELPGVDGKPVKVSTYVGKNKYVLIDFWASWCGPCRAEMPTVVKAYADYHSKGFEVVGVSLDNDKDAWLKAIKELNMPWPQMSDLKGWESAGAALYNVKSIPASVLVDADGEIVAKNLRGDDLLAKLAELMK